MKRKVAKEYKKKSKGELEVTGPPGWQRKVGCSGIRVFFFDRKFHLPKGSALMNIVNNTVLYICQLLREQILQAP